MKTNELMIGDWVNYRGTTIRVTSLYAKSGCNEVGFGIKEETWVDGDHIKPIPITPEILEKSGFKLQPISHYYWGDEFSDIDIEEFTDGLWEVEVWNVEVDMLDCKIYISYVHELQHVLELCGIDRLEVRV